jgi:hypothetical protein
MHGAALFDKPMGTTAAARALRLTGHRLARKIS